MKHERIIWYIGFIFRTRCLSAPYLGCCAFETSICIYASFVRFHYNCQHYDKHEKGNLWDWISAFILHMVLMPEDATRGTMKEFTSNTISKPLSPLVDEHYFFVLFVLVCLKVVWQSPVMLSGPAGPLGHKSGVNRVFKPTVSGWFAKRLFYVQSSLRCSNLGIALNLLRLSEMGPFLIIVVKLYS